MTTQVGYQVSLLWDFPLTELISGSLRYIRTLKPWPLKRVMIEKYLFSEVDAVLLCEFLEPLLATDMRDRTYARDVKDHRWLEITLEDGIVTEW